MATHSPAPFTVVAADHLGVPAYAVRGADGDLIAVGLVKADADLFSAGPDLLAACKRALELLEPFDGLDISMGLGSEALPPLRAAIAAAEGRS